MPYVSPAAIVTGTPISKTTFGDVVKADLDYLANPPSAGVTKAAAQSIANNTLTVVSMDTERWKTVASMHNNATNPSRLIAPDAGLYVISGSASFAGHATGVRAIGLARNAAGAPAYGAHFIAYDERTTPGAAGDASMSIASQYKLAAGDYIELAVYQSSGGALNIVKSANHTPELRMTWIGLG